MDTARADWIWMNGEWIAWDEARIHVLSHVVHYGTSVFEGIRCYDQTKHRAIFRLGDHLRRLFDSARLYRMNIKYSLSDLEEIHRQVVSRNKLKACYIRPVLYRGFDNLGVNPFGKPVEMAVAAFPWGQYLGPEALEEGVSACVSTWRRPAPGTVPTWAKAGGHYMNSQLIKMEAVVNGFVEGIALDVSGNVSEGSGQNIFLVRDGVLYTPPDSASILVGITRDTVITLARDLGIDVREQTIPRDMLYCADEVFFTGTAVEIIPVTSVDRIDIGSGKRGAITAALQEEFFGIVLGRKVDRYGWLTPVANDAAAGDSSSPSSDAATPASTVRE